MADVQTLSDIYFHAAETWNRKDYFSHKVDGAYRPVSMGTFFDAGQDAALGLATLGLSAGDRVAVLSETRLEWAVADMAILTSGCVSVPVYSTLPQESVIYVLKDSGARAVFVSNPEQLDKVRAYAQEQKLETILFEGEDASGQAITLSELQNRGRKLGQSEPNLHRRRSERAGPDDLATIIYTSGTTGDPKGVMLSHGNITSNVVASQEALRVSPSDRHLSFLPMSHILERMAGLYTMLYYGAGISYAESVYTVAENLMEVHPTIMISVPRLYEKIYAQVMEVAESGSALKQGLFGWAMKVARKRSGLILSGAKPGPWLGFQYGLASALVFSKIHKKLGGKIRLLISGGAPLTKDIALFFHAVGLPIQEGYGLTETSPVVAVNTFEAFKPGTVGKPLSGVDVRIAPDGEILVRGPGVMMGYYERPQDTAEAIVDGWFHTGDVGVLDDGGFLRITDRKKDLIVTAGGKNVAPQPIENDLRADRYIAEVVVLGDRKPYLVALVVPNFEELDAWARRHGFDPRPKALAKNPRVLEFLKSRVDELQGSLASYETIKAIGIIQDELTIASGELTPTLKVKRGVVEEKYRELVESLYT